MAEKNTKDTGGANSEPDGDGGGGDGGTSFGSDGGFDL